MKKQSREPELKDKIRFLKPFEKSILETLLILTFTAFLFYLPSLLNSHLLLNRNNDLETFFWPLYSYVKNQILINKQIPFVNNMYFAGTPLLSDPQTPYFYLSNLIFLFLPTDLAFLITFFVHSVFAGFSMFICAKKGFNLSAKSAFISGVIFMSSPKFAGYLEAGHVGLIYSWPWIPLVLLCLIKIAQKPTVRTSVFFGICVSSIFFTHLVTFLIVSSISLVFLGYSLLTKITTNKKSAILSLTLGYLITFGFVAISLFPQIEWSNQSTRFLLLKDRDVYPKWETYKEFAVNVVSPMLGKKYPDSEKLIPIGIFEAIALSVLFVKSNHKVKALSLGIFTTILILALNNKSPLYPLLLNVDYYSLLRVATRFWFIMVLFMSLGIGYLYENIKINKVLLEALIIATIAEQILTSWWYYSKPIIQQTNLAPVSILDNIKLDKSLYRVMCTTRCISAKDALDNNVELIEGYNTVQQINFYKEAWQLTGKYWNYYTLSIPPFGTFLTEKLNPAPLDLGEFNVKYLISPYPLSSTNLTFLIKNSGYYIYKNLLFKDRVYLTNDNLNQTKSLILNLNTPNHKIIEVPQGSDLKKLMFSQVYSKGWRAYLNDKKEALIQERPNTLMAIDINSDTRSVELIYKPDYFYVGALLTTITFIISLVLLTLF
ncbi:hypothetical protein HY045_02585 [Candidatus Woesebacteria bacterium]|nr:hypothetical protein [Candidatus Woesebacteria bacterium]